MTSRPPDQGELTLDRGRYRVEATTGNVLFIRSGGDHSSKTFGKVNFRNLVLSGSSFRDAILMKCDLSDSVFVDTDLSGVSFIGCTFEGARFIDCKFNEAHFLNADCTLAKFVGCEFVGTRFDNSYLGHVEVRSATFTLSLMTRCDLSYGTIRDSHLSMSTFDRCNFGRMDLSGTVWDQCELYSVKLDDADLSDVSVNSTTTHDCIATDGSYVRLGDRLR